MNATHRLITALALGAATAWGRTITEVVPATSEDLIGSLAISYDARGEGDAADALYVAWGETDAGGDLAAWPNVRRVKRLAAEAGTTTFTFPDDALLAGDRVARAFLVSSVAPYDHLVESLHGTGAQYLDTGFTVSPASRASVTFCLDVVKNQIRPFGISSDNGASLLSFDCYINGGGYWASAFKDGSGDWKGVSVTARADVRYQLTLDGPTKTYTVANALTGATLATDSTQHDTTPTATSAGSLYVFARHGYWNNSNGADCCVTAGDLYAFTLASNGVAQCDWAPCTVDGRGGMYDRVSGTVVYSASGTDFSPAGENMSTALLDGETVLSAAAAVTVAGSLPDPTTGAVWKGTASGTWDFASANWLVNGVAGQTWQDGLDAYLNNNASAYSLALGATVKPATLYVQGLRDYTLTGNGLSGTGGLVKTGSGKLTITGLHDFTGDVLLAGGETILTADNDSAGVVQSGLGNPRAAGGRTIVVSNATLRAIGKNPLSGGGRTKDEPTWTVRLCNATLETTTNFPLNVGTLYLHDSAINLHGALDNDNRYPADEVDAPISAAWWGSLWARNLYISGTKPFTLNPSDAGSYRKSALLLGFMGEQAEINVAKIASGADNTDALINIPIAWAASWSVGDSHYASGFRKTGAGVLELGKSSDSIGAHYSTYTGDVDVVEGTLKFSAGKANVKPYRATPFGAHRYPHTVTVHEGARIWFATSDMMGQLLSIPSNFTFVVRGGTLKQTGGACNAFGPTTFDDATFDYGWKQDPVDYYWTKNADGTLGGKETIQWPTLVFTTNVTFTGTKAYNLPNNNALLSFGNGLENPAILHVDELTGEGDSTADLTVNLGLIDLPNWYAYSWVGDKRLINASNPIQSPARALSVCKTGPGMLVLNNVSSTTTGRIEVAEGTLRVGTRGAVDWPATTSALGDLTDPDRVALVVSGSGVFELTASDVFGQAACVNESVFCITNGGTLRSIGNIANGLPRLDLYDANIEYNGGLNSGNNGPYGTFIFAHRVRWDGTRPYDLQTVGTGNAFALGHEVDVYTTYENNVTNLHGKVVFDVADITGDARPDVTLGVVLKTMAWWGGNAERGRTWGKTRFCTGLVKAGAGTLALNGADPDGKYYTEATRVDAGALLVDTHRFASTNVFVAAGAYVGGTGTVKRATFAAGAGLTAAPGQTAPLTLTAAELPGDGSPLVVSVPVAGALKAVTSVRVPIAKVTGALASATFTAVVNGGAEIPTSHSASAFVQDGVLWGTFSRNGLAIILR